MNEAEGIHLLVDDERDPSEPFIQQQFGATGREIWVKTYEEVINHLKNGNISSISLDHDLGENTGTGYDIAKWIEENAYFGKLSQLQWRVHSANPVGRKNINMALSNADKYWSEQMKENIEDHLKSRGMDPSKRAVIVDKKTNTATFLIYNLAGHLIGTQVYDPSAGTKSSEKYTDTHISDLQKPIYAWGIETLKESNHPYVFVCEGVFDAVKIMNMGKSAVATLTNAPHIALRDYFHLLGKKVIVIADNDKAGESLRRIGDVTFTVPDPYKDMGEMPDEEAKQFIDDILSKVH